MIKSIDIKSAGTKEIYQYLSDAITPRPIAFVSTIDRKGNKNLSPFSFFNVFSISPPILVFSPVNRVRNNTSKHTLNNVKETKECVISLVTKDMDQQVSLASCDFELDVNEFEKAGFTELYSELVTPSRIKESPINFECKVNDVISLGNEGGAGNLVLCEVVKIHIDENIIDKNKVIDPLKLKLVAEIGIDKQLKTRFMKLQNLYLKLEWVLINYLKTSKILKY